MKASRPSRLQVENASPERFVGFVEDFNRRSGVGEEFLRPRLFRGIGKTWEIDGYGLDRLGAQFGGLVVPIFHEWNRGFQKRDALQQVSLAEHIQNMRRDAVHSGYLLGAIDDQGTGQRDPAFGAVGREEFFQARRNRSGIIAALTEMTRLCQVEGGTTSIFLGAHTVTRLHQHQASFLFQVLGRKRACLIAPSFENDLYCENLSLYAQNLIDFNNVDLERYPRLRNVTMFDATIEPADLLFIPNGWFHYVEALEYPSLTLSRFAKLENKHTV